MKDPLVRFGVAIEKSLFRQFDALVEARNGSLWCLGDERSCWYELLVGAGKAEVVPGGKVDCGTSAADASAQRTSDVRMTMVIDAQGQAHISGEARGSFEHNGEKRDVTVTYRMLALVLISACGSCSSGQGSKPPAVAMPTGSVTDIDGNVYPTIKIGQQEWMVENLKTTKYNDGTAIPNVTDDSAWPTLSSAAYSWIDNDVANKDAYGAVYNWYAVDSGKLCPSGNAASEMQTCISGGGTWIAP